MTEQDRAQTPRAIALPARLPGQIAYIIGNEGCERFSFYGMRNILIQFLTSSSLMFTATEAVSEADRQRAAKEVFHTFVLGVFFFPLLGGWVADRFLGKYRTILYLSIIYCAGHACLAFFERDKAGFFTGLFLIALGSGGIKPCVSAFVGHQFDQTNKSLAKVVFDAFYWIINFGAFFATLLMPLMLRHFGAPVAFGIPGLLMFAANVVFWLGSGRYVRVPPAPPHPDSFVRVAWSALGARGPNGGRLGLAIAFIGAVVALAFVVLGFSPHTAQRRGLESSSPQRGIQHKVVERDQHHHQQRIERLHLRGLEPTRLGHPVCLQHPRRSLLIKERPERRDQEEQHQNAEKAAHTVNDLIGMRPARPVELPPGSHPRKAEHRHQSEAPRLGDAEQRCGMGHEDATQIDDIAFSGLYAAQYTLVDHYRKPA